MKKARLPGPISLYWGLALLVLLIVALLAALLTRASALIVLVQVLLTRLALLVGLALLLAGLLTGLRLVLVFLLLILLLLVLLARLIVLVWHLGLRGGLSQLRGELLRTTIVPQKSHSSQGFFINVMGGCPIGRPAQLRGCNIGDG